MQKYIEVTNCGGLKIKNVTIKIDSIVSIQKPISEDVGCIIETEASKIPVTESYDIVRNMIGANL